MRGLAYSNAVSVLQPGAAVSSPLVRPVYSSVILAAWLAVCLGAIAGCTASPSGGAAVSLSADMFVPQHAAPEGCSAGDDATGVAVSRAADFDALVTRVFAAALRGADPLPVSSVYLDEPSAPVQGRPLSAQERRIYSAVYGAAGSAAQLVRLLPPEYRSVELSSALYARTGGVLRRVAAGFGGPPVDGGVLSAAAAAELLDEAAANTRRLVRLTRHAFVPGGSAADRLFAGMVRRYGLRTLLHISLQRQIASLLAANAADIRLADGVFVAVGQAASGDAVLLHELQQRLFAVDGMLGALRLRLMREPERWMQDADPGIPLRLWRTGREVRRLVNGSPYAAEALNLAFRALSSAAAARREAPARLAAELRQSMQSAPQKVKLLAPRFRAALRTAGRQEQQALEELRTLMESWPVSPAFARALSALLEILQQEQQVAAVLNTELPEVAAYTAEHAVQAVLAAKAWQEAGSAVPRGLADVVAHGNELLWCIREEERDRNVAAQERHRLLQTVLRDALEHGSGPV